jgi:hypothetical protein
VCVINSPILTLSFFLNKVKTAKIKSDPMSPTAREILKNKRPNEEVLVGFPRGTLNLPGAYQEQYGRISKGSLFARPDGTIRLVIPMPRSKGAKRVLSIAADNADKDVFHRRPKRSGP